MRVCNNKKRKKMTIDLSQAAENSQIYHYPDQVEQTEEKMDKETTMH